MDSIEISVQLGRNCTYNVSRVDAVFKQPDGRVRGEAI